MPGTVGKRYGACLSVDGDPQFCGGKNDRRWRLLYREGRGSTGKRNSVYRNSLKEIGGLGKGDAHNSVGNHLDAQFARGQLQGDAIWLPFDGCRSRGECIGRKTGKN